MRTWQPKWWLNPGHSILIIWARLSRSHHQKQFSCFSFKSRQPQSGSHQTLTSVTVLSRHIKHLEQSYNPLESPAGDCPALTSIITIILAWLQGLNILSSSSHYRTISTVNLSVAGASFQCLCTFWHVSTIAAQKPSEPSQRKYVTYLQNPLLMDTNKIQSFCQEVVSKCFKKALHQWHWETIDPRPRWGIQRLSRWSRCLNKSDTKIN